MTILKKPPTIRSNKFKRFIRVRFLSPHIRNIPTDQKTLDLGCGWGFSFRINPGFHGLDADADCVKYCQEQGFKVVQGGLLMPLPFPSGHFDNCFTHDVLEHFELKHLDLIFQHVHEILRPGGVFINAIPNRLGYDYGLRVNSGHKHYVTPEEVREVAKRTGFKYQGCVSSPFPEVFHRFYTHNKYVTYCERI